MIIGPDLFEKHGPAMPIETHIVARASTNSQRLTTKQHQMGSLLHVRAKNPSGALVPCTLSAVDESGRNKCSITKTKKRKHTSR